MREKLLFVPVFVRLAFQVPSFEIETANQHRQLRAQLQRLFNR